MTYRTVSLPMTLSDLQKQPVTVLSVWVFSKVAQIIAATHRDL